jgi:hypothetical protein
MPALATAMLAVGLLVLVAKPWAGEPQRPGASLADRATPGARLVPSLITGQSLPDRAAAEPSPNPASASPGRPSANAQLAEARRQCYNPDLWRIVTNERTGSTESRSLFPTNPVAARGPDDPAITVASIHASQLLGIGYCVPVGIDRDVSTIERQILIWRQSPSGAYAPVRNTRVLDQALFRLGEAYLAPPIGAPAGTWPGGRYVFEVQRSAAGGAARWFALDFAPNH